MRPVQPIYRVYLFVLCSLSVTAAVDQTKYTKSVTLSYEFISHIPQSVRPLCTVFYNPDTLRYNLTSWSPPSTDDLKDKTPGSTSSPLLRILLPNGSSTVTSLSTFAGDLTQYVSLWLSEDSDRSIFSASITSTAPPPLSKEEEQYRKRVERAKARGKPIPTRPKEPKKKPKKGTNPVASPKPEPQDTEGPQVKIAIIPIKTGPIPKMGSKPAPQIDSEGNEIPPQEEQEKTFFQKYWWIFMLAAVFALTTGGGEK